MFNIKELLDGLIACIPLVLLFLFQQLVSAFREAIFKPGTLDVSHFVDVRQNKLVLTHKIAYILRQKHPQTF
jgi:hypothetical protein